MKTVKPDFYDDFSCIGDKCSFTCCRDWKISVDNITKNKWKDMEVPEIAGKLSEYVVSDIGADKIKLCENGRCPFLTPSGLCRIVLKHGEASIPNTCHTFPRERHSFENRTEHTLTMGCPEALRLLWECSAFNVISDDSVEETLLKEPVLLFDEKIGHIRDGFIAIANSGRYNLSSAIKMMFYMALDYYEKEDDLTEEYILDSFDARFLEQLYECVLEAPGDRWDSFIEQNELFLDIAENYRKKNIYSEIIEPLANLAEEYEDILPDEDTESDIARFDEYFATDPEAKYLLLLAEEIYSTLYLETGNLYTVLIKLEWIGITFSVLKHILFLRWIINNRIIDKKDLYELTTVIIRMTGYSEDDIEDYLEECFETIIWDWGYMALIL